MCEGLSFHNDFELNEGSQGMDGGRIWWECKLCASLQVLRKPRGSVMNLTLGEGMAIREGKAQCWGSLRVRFGSLNACKMDRGKRFGKVKAVGTVMCKRTSG